MLCRTAYTVAIKKKLALSHFVHVRENCLCYVVVVVVTDKLDILIFVFMWSKIFLHFTTVECQNNES